MTSKEDANLGLFPTKGLNHQLLLQYEDVMEGHPNEFTVLKGKYNGVVRVDEEESLRPSGSSKRIGPMVKLNEGQVEIVLPEEWFAFTFLLCSAAYFDALQPLEIRRSTEKEYTPTRDEQSVIEGSLNAIWEYVTTGKLTWPEQLPDSIDEKNPSEEAWQKIKTLYIQAMLFVMLHETSHILNDEHLTFGSMPGEQQKEVEQRCDADAARWLLSHYDGDLLQTTKLSITLAFCAAVIFNKNRPSESHPEPVGRTQAAFQELDIELSDTSLILQTLANSWLLRILGVNTEEILALLDSGDGLDEVYNSTISRLNYL